MGKDPEMRGGCGPLVSVTGVMEIYIVRRVLSYMACLVAVFMGGQAWMILLYRGYLSRHFGLSASEENVVVIAGVIGASFSLPIAYVIEYVGPRWSMLTSTFITSLGLVSIWTTTLLTTDYQPPYFILAFCFFVASTGSAMSLLTGISVALNNVTRRHKAMVCAIMGLVYEASTQFIQLLRRRGFGSGISGNPISPNSEEDILIPRLTFVLLAITILGGFLAVPFIRVYQESRHLDGADDKRLICTLGICQERCAISAQDLGSTNVLQWKSSLSLWKLLGTFEYQCLVWSSGLCLALVQFSRLSLPAVTPNDTVTNNITLYLTCIYSVSAILTRFPLASLLDTYNERLFVYLALFCVKLVGLLSHFLLFMEWNRVVLVTFYVISGVLDGACFFEIIVLTCQMFGYEHLARNIAIPMMMKSVFIAVLEYIHGAVISRVVRDPSETFCYGSNCEFGISLIRLILFVIAVAVFVPLICIRSASFRCNTNKCKTLL